MEEFLAFLFLARVGIVSKEAYQNKLDEAFLADRENELLLDLELNDEMLHVISVAEKDVNWDSIDRDLFGKTLMEQIERYYFECSDIREFGKTVYLLWELLPGAICREQPFWTLSYADEPLSWGDEEQSRSIYQEMFDFYKAKDETDVDSAAGMWYDSSH